MYFLFIFLFFFFFNDTATTEIYTLSLHDALPISLDVARLIEPGAKFDDCGDLFARDRKSTRLNSSHSSISYAVFCLKKKNKKTLTINLDINFHFNNITQPGHTFIIDDSMAFDWGI